MRCRGCGLVIQDGWGYRRYRFPIQRSNVILRVIESSPLEHLPLAVEVPICGIGCARRLEECGTFEVMD